MNDGFDLAALAAAVRSHGSVVRIVVAAYRGSTPRETGTAMLVWGRQAVEAPFHPVNAPDESVSHQRLDPMSPLETLASQAGTIGGGALEWQAAAAARRLAPGPWARQVLRVPLGPALGQCCGGQVTLLLERYGPAEIAWLEAHPLDPFARPTASGLPPDPGALATRRIRRAARSAEAAAVARLEGDLFVEPLAAPDLPVWLYGAGHVGRAIVRAAEDLPLTITWIDTAAERFPDPVPAHATRLVAADPARAAAHAPDDAIHLVLTYSHALDLAICRSVLARPHRHLGLIGSASKKARFLSRLREGGLPEAPLARLHCPIGDRALGKRPAAIALGVVAELLRLPAARAREAQA